MASTALPAHFSVRGSDGFHARATRLEPREAATITTAGVTAWGRWSARANQNRRYRLSARYRRRSIAALQIAKMMGAAVIATFVV